MPPGNLPEASSGKVREMLLLRIADCKQFLKIFLENFLRRKPGDHIRPGLRDSNSNVLVFVTFRDSFTIPQTAIGVESDSPNPDYSRSKLISSQLQSQFEVVAILPKTPCIEA